MDFKVIWSEEAITDLRNICSYIARDNPEAALRMGNGVLDHLRILARTLGDRCHRSPHR